MAIADREHVSLLTLGLTPEPALRVREWVKLRERNEALDLEVYALAARYICGPALVRSLPERAAKWAMPVQGRGEPAVHAQAVARFPAALLRPRRGGWVHNW